MKKKQETKPKERTTKKIQTILDFAQRTPGVRKCPICHLEYQPTVSDDVKTHEKFHKKYVAPLPFHIKESVDLRSESLRRFVKIEWTEKTKDELTKLIEKINQDIDMDMSYLMNENSSFILCIEMKNVIGCLICRETQQTDRIHFCECKEYDELKLIDANKTSAKCCVDVLWVHSQFRRKHVANEMMELARMYCCYGKKVMKEDVAITQPTHDGFAFFSFYFSGKFKLFVPFH